MTAFGPEKMLTASANNDNLCSHFGFYKCKDRKGRESLADANTGKSAEIVAFVLAVAVPAPSRCRGYVENALVSARVGHPSASGQLDSSCL